MAFFCFSNIKNEQDFPIATNQIQACYEKLDIIGGEYGNIIPVIVINCSRHGTYK